MQYISGLSIGQKSVLLLYCMWEWLCQLLIPFVLLNIILTSSSTRLRSGNKYVSKCAPELAESLTHWLYCRPAVPHRREWSTEGPSFPGARLAAVAVPPPAHSQSLCQHASRQCSQKHGLYLNYLITTPL